MSDTTRVEEVKEKKDWEKDYTPQERREIVANQLSFQIIDAIKKGVSPILQRASKEELAKNAPYNGFNGMPLTGLNTIILEGAKVEHNYSTGAWLSGLQAVMMKVGIDKEVLKNLKGVKIQSIKTREYEHQYELDENNNKIPLKKDGKVCLNDKGEIMYKRLMEKAMRQVPQTNELGKILKDKEGKKLYAEEPIPLLDSKGNIKLDEKGNVEYLMQFAPDTYKELESPILETTTMYNVQELLGAIKGDENIKKFHNKIKSRRDDDKLNKHYNSHLKFDKETNKEIDIVNKEIRLDDLHLNDDTKKAINSLYYAKNNGKDFIYPLKKLSKEEYLGLQAKRIEENAIKRAEQAKEAQSNTQESTKESANNTQEKQASINEPAKSPYKKPKSKDLGMGR